MQSLSLVLLGLTCAVAGGFAVFLMMQKKLTTWQVKYEEMRAAFQEKHLANQQLWLGQQNLYELLKESWKRPL
jgi:hypothetical protein